MQNKWIEDGALNSPLTLTRIIYCGSYVIVFYKETVNLWSWTLEWMIRLIVLLYISLYYAIHHHPLWCRILAQIVTWRWSRWLTLRALSLLPLWNIWWSFPTKPRFMSFASSFNTTSPLCPTGLNVLSSKSLLSDGFLSCETLLKLFY